MKREKKFFCIKHNAYENTERFNNISTEEYVETFDKKNDSLGKKPKRK